MRFTSLPSLLGELERQRGNSADAVVPSTRCRILSYHPGLNTPAEAFKAHPVRFAVDGGIGVFAGPGSFGLTDNAHRQIAEKTAVPWPYYERMLQKAPALLAENLNVWLGQEEGEARLLRVLDGNLRAFLSNRYRVVSHVDILTTAVEAAQEAGAAPDSGGITTDRLDLSDTHFRLTLVNRGQARSIGNLPNGEPDLVWPGVVVSNSETGNGGLSVMPRVLRQVCVNGLVIDNASAWGYRLVHLGKTLEEIGLLSRSTVFMENAVLFSKIRDVVRGLLGAGDFWAGVVDRFRESMGRPIAGPAILPTVAGFVAERGMSAGDRKAILDRFLGTAPTVFNLFNAVTNLAGEKEDLEAAASLEAGGGSILYADDERMAKWAAEGERVLAVEARRATATLR